ncbi:DUF1302 domain-containing protein [Acinetobacter sp. ANC 3832]|uniref:DUF1302 domain-containing protein n=1 Tax=Acinetobacter sp. ANC 3832 TaxID=1977874 RepID=UPI000A332D46|nr:DUF1302 domain-containing protein [Acinetobacter sp. ANC 3832]OTG91184.1 hypothetical protein B9T35_14755 [Acinetobacter sp. ANC 3832]
MVHKSVCVNGIRNNILIIQKFGVLCGLVFSISEVSAASFELNQDWKLETNTSLSIGQSWSTANPDAALLYRPDALSIGKEGSSIDINGDNGRANFEKGDAISQIIKGFTEFKLNGKQQGAVLSAKYWYDHAYETSKGDFTAFDDSAWPRLVKFKGVDLWDAYIWKNFNFENSKSLELKLGKHALNWGKSQFFQNGLNSVSAFDYAAMNRPGGDVKERIIPVEMFSFVAGLNDKLKVEGFYQFKFRPSVIDGCGTFFEVSDVFAENCGPLLISGPGFTSDQAMNGPVDFTVARLPSEYAKNSGQYGVAIKQIIPSLNNAELGAYYANYHSRILHFDGVVVSEPGVANYHTARIVSVYPEDIQMYGLSLTAKVGKTAIFSELNYKPNMPLHFNSTDMVYAQALYNDTPLTAPNETLKLGERIQGFAEVPVTQFTLGAASSIPNVLGASALSLVGEMGINHIGDTDQYHFGRSGAFGRSGLSTGAYDPSKLETYCITPKTGQLSDQEVRDLNAKYCNSEGFFEEWSMGYRLRGALSYNDLLAGTVISPSLMFRHDLKGYGLNFQEGQMAISAGVSATYQKKYVTELSYTNFFGSNEFSVLDDRDFASLVFKVNF